MDFYFLQTVFFHFKNTNFVSGAKTIFDRS